MATYLIVGASGGIGSALCEILAADDHQSRNAEVFVNAGAARMTREDQLTGEGMASMITAILEDPADKQAMANAAKALAVPNAAERVCEAIEQSLAA